MSSDWFQFLKKDFVQGFPAFCGFEVVHADFGIFDTRLTVHKELQQQDGFIHAGVLATMADHTAGYAESLKCVMLFFNSLLSSHYFSYKNSSF